MLVRDSAFRLPASHVWPRPSWRSMLIPRFLDFFLHPKNLNNLPFNSIQRILFHVHPKKGLSNSSILGHLSVCKKVPANNSGGIVVPLIMQFDQLRLFWSKNWKISSLPATTSAEKSSTPLKISVNTLRTNPTRRSNTLKQFVDNSRRIIWMCLTILWGWRLKG